MTGTAAPWSGPAVDDMARRLAFLVLPAGPFLMLLDQDVSEIWVAAVVVVFLVRSVLRRDFSWAQPMWMRVAFVFWVWICLVSLGAPHLYEAMQHAVPWMRFPVLAAALVFWLGPSVELRRRMLEAMIVALAILVVILVLERLQNPELVRLYGPLSRPRPGWFMLGVGLPVAMLALGRMTEARQALWAVPCVALLAAVTVSTGEVYNSIAFVFALALYVAAARMLSWKLALAGAAALVGCAAVLATNEELLARFTTETLARLPWRPQSDYHNPWTVGLEVALANPWLGVGVENFGEHCDALLAAGGLAHLDVQRCYPHPHNLYLQVFAETGAPGLALLATLVAALLWRAARAWDWRAPLPIAAMAVAILVMVFWPVSSYSNAFGQQKNHFTWFLIGWALVCAHVAQHNAGRWGREA